MNTPDHSSDSGIEALQELLRQETHILTDMAKKMQDKKISLINGNVAGLMEADQHLVALGQKTTQMERKRLELMGQMGHQEITLEQLITRVHPAQARPLAEARHKMQRVLSEIQELNRNNGDLLKLAITWVEDTVNLIAGHLTPETASYTATGNKTKNGAKTEVPAGLRSTVIHDA